MLIKVGADRLVGAAAGTIPPQWLWAGLRADITLYPRPTIRRARRDGVTYDLDLSDYMQWTVYYSVERGLRERLYGLVRPGDVAIDVGTNIGEVLLNVARLAGANGRAIGFEPNPETFARCQANIALNPFANVEVHALGLGHVEAELHFGRRSIGNSGGDAFMPAGADTIQVPVTTLDRFVEKHGLDRIDLIKVDVEGFETNVVRGGEVALRRFRPRLFVELCDDNLRAQGSSAAELVALLERLDYAVSNAASGAPVSSKNDFADCFLDVLCVPR